MFFIASHFSWFLFLLIFWRFILLTSMSVLVFLCVSCIFSVLSSFPRLWSLSLVRAMVLEHDILSTGADDQPAHWWQRCRGPHCCSRGASAVWRACRNGSTSKKAVLFAENRILFTTWLLFDDRCYVWYHVWYRDSIRLSLNLRRKKWPWSLWVLKHHSAPVWQMPWTPKVYLASDLQSWLPNWRLGWWQKRDINENKERNKSFSCHFELLLCIFLYLLVVSRYSHKLQAQFAQSLGHEMSRVFHIGYWYWSKKPSNKDRNKN